MPGFIGNPIDVCNGVSYGASNTAGGWGGTYVNPSATADTKGSWVQLTASTSSDIRLLLLKLTGRSGSTAYTSMLMDIGIGASGSEQVLINNIMWYVGGATVDQHYAHALPISIPSGTRVAARTQCTGTTGTSSNLQCSFIGFDSAFSHPFSGSGVDAVGVSTSTGVGVSVVSGNGAKGSYSQIIASTAKDYIGFFFVADGTTSNTSTFNARIDIAVGASGSEVIIAPDRYFYLSSFGASPFIPVQIPAGSRIAARADDNAGGAATFGFTLYGVYA